jgi:hypothetical protein
VTDTSDEDGTKGRHNNESSTFKKRLAKGLDVATSDLLVIEIT